jgi:hypothetical protein
MWMILMLTACFWCAVNSRRTDGVGMNTQRCTTHAQCRCMPYSKSVSCARREITSLPRPFRYWGIMLRRLDASNNNIVDILDTTLTGWTSLMYLDLQGNPLSTASCVLLGVYEKEKTGRVVLTDCER